MMRGIYLLSINDGVPISHTPGHCCTITKVKLINLPSLWRYTSFWKSLTWMAHFSPQSASRFFQLVLNNYERASSKNHQWQNFSSFNFKLSCFSMKDEHCASWEAVDSYFYHYVWGEKNKLFSLLLGSLLGCSRIVRLQAILIPFSGSLRRRESYNVVSYWAISLYEPRRTMKFLGRQEI